MHYLMDFLFLFADFLILFFTEALFYGGVAIFVFLIDKVWRPLQQVAPKSYIWSKSRFFCISSVTTMVLSLIIPLLTMGMVWPWTGPAASATLAPYLVGLVVQFAFEQYARHRKSPSWPVIPIIFKVTFVLKFILVWLHRKLSVLLFVLSGYSQVWIGAKHRSFYSIFLVWSDQSYLLFGFWDLEVISVSFFLVKSYQCIK